MTEHRRLEKIHVSGVFGKGTVEVDLFDPGEDLAARLHLLFDDNGRGKTTVLRSVFHLLSCGDLDHHLVSLAELPVEGIRLKLTDGVVEFSRSPTDPDTCWVEVTREAEVAKVEFELGRFDPRNRNRLIRDQRDSRAYRELVKKVAPPPVFISDDRGIYSDDLLGWNHPRRLSNHGGASPASRTERERVQQRETFQLQELYELLSRQLTDDVFLTKVPRRTDSVYADVVSRLAGNTEDVAGDLEVLRARVDQLLEDLALSGEYGLLGLVQLERVRDELAKVRKNASQRETMELVLDPFLSSLEAEAERMQPTSDKIHRLVSTVNDFLRDKRMDFRFSRGFSILAGEGRDETLDMGNLSSGERHLLLLFGAAAIAKSGQLVIIDEPELSLGIEWKRRLLGSLLEMTSVSGCDFLIASHSVEVITPFLDHAQRLRSEGGSA